MNINRSLGSVLCGVGVGRVQNAHILGVGHRQGVALLRLVVGISHGAALIGLAVAQAGVAEEHVRKHGGELRHIVAQGHGGGVVVHGAGGQGVLCRGGVGQVVDGEVIGRAAVQIQTGLRECDQHLAVPHLHFDLLVVDDPVGVFRVLRLAR